ncbi:hypothetical protein AVEN_220279-1 [Araneus ventricosus]|uniref:Uncharacterized protein n=1 Tax=Araneus ventricosus TaxID=182803 RepID=A0A4Y2S818_ARAVE|nr:hypothetical protein AVEN_11584-1 [Araneus ventricosus]GBN83437.1 hypothetical protein AVEN_30346-1 [Araneus ventricosus]GBN83491.1 hypothetical protein AVEN_220279-1 [Araneus ventricosus]
MCRPPFRKIAVRRGIALLQNIKRHLCSSYSVMESEMLRKAMKKCGSSSDSCVPEWRKICKWPMRRPPFRNKAVRRGIALLQSIKQRLCSSYSVMESEMLRKAMKKCGSSSDSCVPEWRMTH